MRICLVSQQYPPHTAVGGIGSQVYAKAHGLEARGHEVCVIAAGDGTVRNESRDRNVRVIRIPSFHHRMPIFAAPVEWITHSTEVAAAVSWLHSESPLDLLEFPDWGAEGYIYLLNRCERNRVTTVIHLHGPLVMFAHTVGWPDLSSEFYRVGTMMESSCLRLADAVYSSSECSATWCERYYGLNREGVPVLHTGVDTGNFYPRPVPKFKRPTIIFVGRIDEHKGVVLLVEAACQLAKRYPDLQVRMFGRGDAALLRKLRAMAGAAGHPRLLDFPGFIDRQDLPLHLSRSHVFAAPSEYEGGPGLVYLEAMACGLPVVACSSGGVSEVIRDEEHGLLIPPLDAEALVNALDRLLRDVALREAMGARARRHVEKSADSDVCLRRIEAFYDRVTQTNRNARSDKVTV